MHQRPLNPCKTKGFNVRMLCKIKLEYGPFGQLLGTILEMGSMHSRRRHGARLCHVTLLSPLQADKDA
jgi:hypothetical protein